MNRYTKVIRPLGSYFVKDYEKKKKDLIKVREIKESTVKKFFLNGEKFHKANFVIIKTSYKLFFVKFLLF